MAETQPVNCAYCDQLQSNRAGLDQVAKHFNEAHPEYVKILKTAVAIHVAQSFGWDTHG